MDGVLCDQIDLQAAWKQDPEGSKCPFGVRWWCQGTDQLSSGSSNDHKNGGVQLPIDTNRIIDGWSLVGLLLIDSTECHLQAGRLMKRGVIVFHRLKGCPYTV